MPDVGSRDAIVAAAAKLLDANGIEAVSIRNVAEASNFSRTSVVHHVGTKEQLLDLLHLVAAEAFTIDVVMVPTVDLAAGPGARSHNAADGDAEMTAHALFSRFKAAHPGYWDLLRFRRCPNFTEDEAPATWAAIEHRLRGGVIPHKGRIVDAMAHQMLSLHELIAEMPAEEAHRMLLNPATATYMAKVFGLPLD